MLSIKLNWGTGIAVFYISFVLILVGFVIFTTFNRVDLVDENYYEKELVYQDNINKINRTKKLAIPLKIESGNNIVNLSFPDSLNYKSITGDITFFRPSDKKMDFKLKIQPDENGNQFVRTENLKKGLWKVKVDWALGDSAFYNEEIVIIN